MILLAAVLVLAAIGLLAAGLIEGSTTLQWASFGASALAAVVVVVGEVRRNLAARRGEPGDERPVPGRRTAEAGPRADRPASDQFPAVPPSGPPSRPQQAAPQQPEEQPYGQQTQGGQAWGSQPYGQPEHGRPDHGHPQVGQTQFGQTQFGQPQYEQPQYEQPQFGQPQYGQERYGQPAEDRAWGSTAYGQQPGGDPSGVADRAPHAPPPGDGTSLPGAAGGPTTGGHEALGADGRPALDADGEPPVEEVEVTDLLVVLDLTDEVLVVDEHPRYHLAGCPHIGGEVTFAMPMVEARTDGFTPCATCAPDRNLARVERARRAR